MLLQTIQREKQGVEIDVMMMTGRAVFHILNIDDDLFGVD